MHNPSQDAREPLSRLHFGLSVELKALAWYLDRHPGARLLERGYRWRGGEIDLILEEPSERHPSRSELVFVEVRARLEGSWVNGIDSVVPGKIRKLANGIELYLSRYRGRAQSVRLDLLAWDGVRWEHLKNALQI